MTIDLPPGAIKTQRDAFVHDLVEALAEAGIDKVDAIAAKNSGSMLLSTTSNHRPSEKSSTSTSSTSPSDPRQLARAAHARLQFDFPSLDLASVDALAEVVARGGGEQEREDLLLLAPTLKLVRALAGDPPSLLPTVPTEDEEALDDGDDIERQERERERALDAAAASARSWDRLAVSYTSRAVLSVLSSSFSTSSSSNSSSQPLSLLLSKLAAELDEEGDEVERAGLSATAAAGIGGGNEGDERALAAFLGGEASAAASPPASSDESDKSEQERGGGYESDESDYDTPIHVLGDNGGGAFSLDAAAEGDSDSTPPLPPPPSFPSAVRAMVALVQAARCRVGEGWAEFGGIELTAACLRAVRESGRATASTDDDSDSRSPPLRRLGTELLLLARDGAVASPIKGAAALPGLLSALGAFDENDKSFSGLADAAELFAAVVQGWCCSTSSSATPSSRARTALARAWRDATTAGSGSSLLAGIAAALSAATGGGGLPGARAALLRQRSGDDDGSLALLDASCSALASLLRAASTASASAGDEVRRCMMSSGVWRVLSCLLAAAVDENDGDESRKRFLRLPRGALDAALLGSAASSDLAAYLAASPAGKFVSGAAEAATEVAMLSALFATATTAAKAPLSSPFSSSTLASMVSNATNSKHWRSAAALMRAIASVGGSGGAGAGGRHHRWGDDVDAAVAKLERALAAASEVEGSTGEAGGGEEQEGEREEKKGGPEAAFRREALRLASAERKRAASVATAATKAKVLSSAASRGKDD